MKKGALVALPILVILISIAVRRPGQLRLEYTPPFLPVQISVDSTGTVSLQGDRIVTPIGSFALGADIPVARRGQLLIIVTAKGQHVYDLAGVPQQFRLPEGNQSGSVRLDDFGNVRIELQEVAPTDDDGLISQTLNSEMYFGVDMGTWRFRNGEYDDGPMWARISRKSTHLADIDHDGDQDVLTHLVWSGGGSGVFQALIALSNDNGKLVKAGEAHLGDRTLIRSVSAHDGLIAVDIVEHGPNDGMCCPTLHRLRTYRFRNGQGLIAMDSRTAP
jgi:hypothetical protein